MACKGIHKKFYACEKWPVRYHLNTSLFEQGWKWDKECRFWTKTGDISCQCCKMRFRTRRRNSVKDGDRRVVNRI